MTGALITVFMHRKDYCLEDAGTCFLFSSERKGEVSVKCSMKNLEDVCVGTFFFFLNQVICLHQDSKI